MGPHLNKDLLEALQPPRLNGERMVLNISRIRNYLRIGHLYSLYAATGSEIYINDEGIIKYNSWHLYKTNQPSKHYKIEARTAYKLLKILGVFND